MGRVMPEPETPKVQDGRGFMVAASATVEHQDGWLLFTFWDELHGAPLARVRLDAPEVLNSLGQLVNQAMYAVEDAVTQLVRGECATCGNRRLVVIEKHGRPWTERCPDCAERIGTTTESALAARPRVVKL